MARKDGTPFSLLPNEELILTTRPHPLAMSGLMVFWLGMAGLGIVYLVYYPDLIAFLGRTFKLDFLARFGLDLDFLAKHGYDVIWFASLLLPLVLMAVFRINFGYVLVLLLLLAARVAIWWKAEEILGIKPESPYLENYLLIGVGLLGLIGVELFRRGHRYYLTTHRIVARFGTLKVSERITLYSKIDDLILQKGLLGKVLNFGTVIPVTATGLGMGQDLALAGAQAGAGKAGLTAGVFAAGGKAANVPRALSIYVLYQVKRPERARNLILAEMEAREQPRRSPAPS